MCKEKRVCDVYLLCYILYSLDRSETKTNKVIIQAVLVVFGVSQPNFIMAKIGRGKKLKFYAKYFKTRTCFPAFFTGCM